MVENNKDKEDESNEEINVNYVNKQNKQIGKVNVVKDPLFNIGDVVKHRIYPFRGVIVDVDPEFSNTEEWYQSIPSEIRPSKEQPYYHLMAENSETFYSAYVSQQNLLHDSENGPVDHPDIEQMFTGMRKGKYLLKSIARN